MKQISLALAAAAALGAAALAAQPPGRPFDLLITNARIIDGTGTPSATGSVAVRDGRIVGVGRVTGAATRTIDARGLVLAPGFIDPHSHSDFSLLTDGNAESKIRQGVTTEVIGESGSVAPQTPTAERGWSEAKSTAQTVIEEMEDRPLGTAMIVFVAGMLFGVLVGGRR